MMFWVGLATGILVSLAFLGIVIFKIWEAW